MPRLPVVGGDLNGWSTILNEFLRAVHNEDGSLKDGFITAGNIDPADIINITTLLNVYTKAEAYATGEVDTVVSAAVDDLSGVTDAPTARTNLDVLSSSEVNALIDDLSGVTDAASARSNLSVLSVAELAAAYLALSGGTLTNFLTLHSGPVLSHHAATKLYVDLTAGTPPAASVGQTHLKTAIGEVSHGYSGAGTSGALLTLPGGAFGFYPQSRYALVSGSGTITYTYKAHALAASLAVVTDFDSGYVTYFYAEVADDGAGVGTKTTYGKQRYVTASAPYSLGNGDIPLFIFALVDNTTGDVVATYASVTPPWVYNGRPENTFDPKKYKKKEGKKNYFYDRLLPLPDKETDFNAYLAATNNPTYEEIEITPAMKNLDMDIIPHPFIGNDLTGKSIVLLDPVGSMAEKLAELQDMGECISDLCYGRYLLIDNEDTDANSPIGVKTHKIKWKNS